MRDVRTSTMRVFKRLARPVAQRLTSAVEGGGASGAMLNAATQQTRAHHPDPRMMDMKGWKAAVKEASLPTTRHDAEVKRNLEIGLQGSSSLEDKTIPTFSRGELPHFAGINTFMKAPCGRRA